MGRILGEAILLLASSMALVAQTSGRQGDPKKDQPHDFRSPMILETSFPDPKTWTGEWFTNQDYRDLEKYRCDGIRIVELFANVRPVKGGEFTILIVRFRAKVLNPDGNHDKEVVVRFDVKNGEDVVRSTEFGPVKVEESNSVKREVFVTVPTGELKSDSRTGLVITVSAWNK